MTRYSTSAELWDTKEGWILLTHFHDVLERGAGKVTRELIDRLRAKYHPEKIVRNACLYVTNEVNQ